MSCVALANAIRNRKAIEPWNHKAVGSVKAMPARALPISSCIASTHQRLVLRRSMNGLHNGFITHGRASQPV